MSAGAGRGGVGGLDAGREFHDGPVLVGFEAWPGDHILVHVTNLDWMGDERFCRMLGAYIWEGRVVHVDAPARTLTVRVRWPWWKEWAVRMKEDFRRVFAVGHRHQRGAP